MNTLISHRRVCGLLICVTIAQVIILIVYWKWINKVDNVVFSQVDNTNAASCSVTDPQAISALNRMKSNYCRHQCHETYCLIQHRPPWPDRLSNQCGHYNSAKYGLFHGCYSVNEDIFSLNGVKKKKEYRWLNNTSHSECLSTCLQHNHRFAGRLHDHCLCANSIEFLAPNQSNFKCDTQCLNGSLQCSNQLQIYETGLQRTSNNFSSSLKTTTEKLSFSTTPRIMFLLIINGRSLLQIHRLLRNIYSDQHYYYIHVDARHQWLYQELLPLEDRFTNIRFAQKRFASIWGGSSLLSTILSCIQDVFGIEHWDEWNFILNLSETDFPIKPIAELERYLASNLNKNFIKSHGKSTFDFVRAQALDRVFLECEHHMWRIGNRTLIKGLVWDGGSDWFVLSKEFAKYAALGSDLLLDGLKNYYHYALLPAESFFHVLLHNSKYCSSRINNNLRITNWNRKKGCKCQHKNVVDWCGCSPNDFRIKDNTRLLSTRSKPLYFARKFEHVVDSDVIDFVEQSLLSNTMWLLKNSVYLENIHSALYDQPLPISTINFYAITGHQLSTFVRTHACFSSNHSQSPSNHYSALTLQFDESYAYFRHNKRQGLLLKYNMLLAGVYQAHVEAILRRYTNETIINAIPSIQLQSLQVCTKFDPKEDIFRDYICLLDSSSILEVLHHWSTNIGNQNITLVLLDPSNHIHLQQPVVILNANQSKGETIKLLTRLSHLRYPLELGTWKVILFDHSLNWIAAHKFAVLPGDGKDYSNSDEVKEALPQANVDIRLHKAIEMLIEQYAWFFVASNELFWYIDQICIQPNKSQSLSYCDQPICDQMDWSTRNVKVRYSL